MLSAPLRERFGLIYHLDYYTDVELEQIVTRSAGVLGIPIDVAGAATIARRSRGTPRIANRLLRRVRDFAEVRADGKIDEAVADEALRREGVDAKGLDRLDRAFLKMIDTLEDVVEPYLLKIGFVLRTAAGRKVTDLAYEHLELETPKSQPRLL